MSTTTPERIDAEVCTTFLQALEHDAAQTALADVFAEDQNTLHMLEGAMKKIIDAKIADDANPSELLSPYEISTLRTLRTSDEDCDALNTKLETLVRLIIKQSEKDGTLPNWADHPVITADGKFDVRLIIDWMLGKKNDNQNSPEITTDLSRVPGSVTTRLENDYDGDEKGLHEALQQLSDWKILRKKQKQGESNTIEAPDGKKIAVLMPEFKDGEVYQNTNIEKGDYTNTRYVKGTSLNQTVDQAGKKLWNTVDDFTKWLQKNMPGKDITSKYRNFIELLDLEKSGIRRSDGKFDSMSDRGNFWISRADGVGSWRLDFGGVHVVVDWNDLDGARPVVCFED